MAQGHGARRHPVPGHPCDLEHTSYRSQITSVFRHPGKKDLFIALADRWLTDLPPELPDYEVAFDAAFSAGEEEKAQKFAQLREMTKDLSAQNTSLADYVWLPVRFDGDMALLDWHDEWRVEDYE